MNIMKLVIATLVSVVGCVASSPIQEGDVEQNAPATATTQEDLQDPGLVTSTAVSPAATCGFQCIGGDLPIEIPFNFCVRRCPGGADNCVPVPPPCP